MTQMRQDTIGGSLSLMLGVALLFWLIPDWVEPDPDLRLPVSFVPEVLAIGFIVSGAVMLVRSLILRSASGEATVPGFSDGEIRSLIAMIAILLGATLAYHYVHFLIVSPAMVAVSMWVFGPLRPVSLLLTATAGPTLVWILGTQVLGRVLP